MEVAGIIDSTVAVGCLAAVVCAGFIMVIMKYSFASQEAEYGEHISTLYGTGSALKSKAAKAEKKKKAKLAKANLAKNLAQDADNQYGHHHVAIDPEPVILGTGGQAHPPVKPRKRKVSKPILHNKDEVPLVQTEEVEARLEFTSNTIPIDEAELLHRRQQQQLADDQRHLPAPADNVDIPEQVEEEIVVAVQSANQKASLPQALDSPDSHLDADSGAAKTGHKRGRKKGDSQLAAALEYINQSQLSDEESQRLIEALIDQTGSALWERKSLLVEASQQLQTLRSALESEKTSLAWTNEKLQEANSNLSLAERNQMTAKAQIQEMQRRLQQLHEQHRAEVQGIQQARFQEIQRMQQHSQQLREENQSLRQALPNSDEMVQMRTQLCAVETELKEQQRHVAKAESKCQDLTTRLGSASEGYRQEGMRCAELNKRVDELSFQHSRVERERSECQSRAQAAENDLHLLQEHLRDKDVEIKELHTEILSAKQATADTVSTTSLADNKKIQELESTVSTLHSSLDAKQSEVDSLQAQLSEAEIEVEHVSAAVKPQTNGLAEGGDAAHNQLLVLEERLAKAESEVDEMKAKNNELRKKNWSMGECLDKAETAAASVSLLEAEIDEKSALVHDLKALNQRLSKQNSELQARIDQPSTTTSTHSPSELLRRQLNSLKQHLDEKDETIRGLEVSLTHERDKVAATEAECKNLLENELHKTVGAIEDQHSATIDTLQYSLDQSEARITDLESLLHQSEIAIKQIIHSDCSAGQEVRQSRNDQPKADNQLSTILKKLNPEFDTDDSLSIEQLLERFYEQSLSKSHADNHYKQALVKTDSMLDQLSETWQGKLEEKDKLIAKLKDQLLPLQERSASSSECTVDNGRDEAMRLASSGSLHDFSSTV